MLEGEQDATNDTRSTEPGEDGTAVAIMKAIYATKDTGPIANIVINTVGQMIENIKSSGVAVSDQMTLSGEPVPYTGPSKLETLNAVIADAQTPKRGADDTAQQTFFGEQDATDTGGTSTEPTRTGDTPAIGIEQRETTLPILDLLIWMKGDNLGDKLERLMLIEDNAPNRAMQLIAGENQENGIPPLHPDMLEQLRQGASNQHQQDEIHEILVGLQQSLRDLLVDVAVYVTPEEHPLNQQALEILRALEGHAPYKRAKEPEVVMEHSSIPILELIARGLSPLEYSPYLDKWIALSEMEEEEMLRTIEGPNQENGLPDLTNEELELLKEDELGGLMLLPKPKRWTAVEWAHQDLRQDLRNMMDEVKLLSKAAETDAKIQTYIDEFLARRAARPSTLTPEPNSDAVIYVMPNQDLDFQPVMLTPEQEELLSDWSDVVDEDTLDMLTQKNTLTDDEQELLEALKADPNALTSEQEELLTDWGDVVSENKLDMLTQKDNLDTFEQELFEALKEGLKNTISDTQKTETDPEIAKAPNTSSAQEKVTHHPSGAGISSYFRHKNSAQAKVVHDPKDHVKAPDSAIDCYNRGIAKYYLGQYEAAITDFDDAIQLKPDYTFAYNRRGLAKYYLGHYEAAITDFNNAIQLKPDSAIYYHNRGRAKHGLSQYEAAIADFDNAIQLKSDHAAIYCNRAEAKRHLGQYKIAIWDYDSAIRLRPHYALAYYNRGNAKAKLGQTTEAEQDWRTALKLATQTGNMELKNLVESLLHSSAGSQVKEKSVHYSEDQVKDIVANYFKSLRISSPGYSVKREYLIQMGSSPCRADIVFLRNGKLVAITECKRTGRIESGHDQLKSYLCATDTFLGIFANHSDPNEWTFWENHRHNNFVEIDRKTFENYVYNHDKAIKDRENKTQEEVQREIDAEIRDRVRKNTDTNTVRQNETDRIKREVIEDIDKKAIVNNVKSEIAQQAENGLLNKRDEENRKRGREQGFWWTIFSLIGILIALLITSAG